MRNAARAALAGTILSAGCGSTAAPSAIGVDAGGAADSSTAPDGAVAPDATGESSAGGDAAVSDAGVDASSTAEDAPAGDAAATPDGGTLSDGSDDAAAPGDAGALAWATLHNPILQVAGWATKDVAVVYEGGVYYFYYSAFFPDTGMERCHVAMSTSPDLK